MLNTVIKGTSIGEGAPMFVIAEVACAHEGNFQALKQLIDIALLSGADAVKFQVFNTAAHMTSSHKNFDLVKGLSLSPDQWMEAVAYVRSRSQKILVLADIYDEASIPVVERMNVDMIKIHSADLSNHGLIRKTGKLNKPTMMGIGASTLEEINNAVAVFRETNPQGFLMLMHGFQAFPTPFEEVNIRQIQTLKESLHLPIGFLDHTEGDTPESLFLPLVALAAGACAVEKHIVIDRSKKGVDYESALSLPYFQDFMRLLRKTELALGSSHYKPLTDKEKQYRVFMKKSIVAAREIKSGEVLTSDMIALKRSLPGLGGEYVDQLIGRKTNRTFNMDENITIEGVEGHG